DYKVTGVQTCALPISAYIVNPSRDGTIYYIKGQKISTSNGSNCGASGFHGAAATVQPTPYIEDVASASPAVIAGQTGNAVPQIKIGRASCRERVWAYV